jgi:hypothetical protein
MSDVDTQTQLGMDAGRSAIAVIRAMRKGDTMAAIQLASTMDDAERGNLVGALAALANQLLNVLDDVTDYARSHGCPELTQTSDHVMAMLALGFIDPDSAGPWKD